MNIRDILIYKLELVPAILIAFTFHEYAHALIADKLGDKTPKFQGRLTLNPAAHIDIVGFIMIILVGFGFAKPVETNPGAYKNYYKDDLKVSIAGPLANLITAFIFAIICGIFSKLAIANSITAIIYILLVKIVGINCMFSIFNMIPIPGFDGYHVIQDLFPKFGYKISAYEKYGMLLFFVMIIPIGTTSIADIIVGIPSNLLSQLFMKIGALI
ncbi:MULTISPECIES: site-2 protease family protein [Clostridium]|uniref:site-2 protease family protein n=1 Tax=Clostridium TaxID=1485 RepID=UPI0008243083|nr:MULTISPECIES: site-2 protease family protein [Clostridium]PJI09490.1 site-2 protease family protein [Clostridium sp. CT7]